LLEKRSARGSIRNHRSPISNSVDGTAEFLRDVATAYPNVRHLPGPYGGRAGARNAGITAARGGVVFFTDSDIIASPDLLTQHLSRHRQESGIAIVGMEVQVAVLEEYERKSANPRAAQAVARNRVQAPLVACISSPAMRRAPGRSHAAGCSMKRFTGYGHEDLELGYRLEKSRSSHRV